MQQLVRILLALDARSRKRALEYVNERFEYLAGDSA